MKIMRATWIAMLACLPAMASAAEPLREVTDGSVPIPLAAVVRVLAYPDESSGTGFAVDRNGLIITAASVVEKARSIWVFTRDQRSSKAELLSTSRETGVAVIRADKLDLPPLQLAKRDVLPGEPVQVVGFDGSRSVLVMDSGVARFLEGKELHYTRSRRSIPGLSGAPVFLRSGEVVAMHWGARPSLEDPVAIGVPAALLRRDLADIRLKFAFPDQVPAGTSRKWRAFFQLECGQTLSEPIRATIPLREGEVIASVSAVLEGLEQVEVVQQPVATLEASGSGAGAAITRFEIKGPSKFPLVPCSLEGRATLVVTFLVRPPINEIR